MSDCASIDPLVAAYVDNELDAVERERVRQHLNRCPPCHSRVSAEQAVQQLMCGERHALCGEPAPEALRVKCRALADAAAPSAAVPGLWLTSRTSRTSGTSSAWRSRVVPLACAASLVAVVGGAFLYQLTATSSRVMAAELAADHIKCFTMNTVLRPHQNAASVEGNMASGFGWQAHLPDEIGREGLELLGARPCLYGEGRVAHIMYRHNGRAVSLFMLPRNRREDEIVDVFGHEAAIWSTGERTFVLVARESRADVERLAVFVRATLH